ncbi:MAG: hypothetical protein KAT70_09445, partial [Thermoplasmata archaeon]|nr:hypothetical protein [Thermoplasmata archaeon]
EVGISGTLTVSGTVQDDHGISSIKLKIDDGNWNTVEWKEAVIGEDMEWSYDIDLAALDAGEHTIRVKVVDMGGQYSVTDVEITLTEANGDTDGDGKAAEDKEGVLLFGILIPPVMLVGVLLMAIALISLALLLARRRRYKRPSGYQRTI